MSEVVRRVVVVGASLAGLRAAEELRRLGFDGSLTVVGDEPHRPYDRTPMSKGALTGAQPPGSTQLAADDDLEAQWLLGVPAAALDRQRRHVVLADGRQLPYDRALVATGRRARPWPDPATAGAANVVTVRTREDGAALRARLSTGPARVLVVGAGFVGSEVASACRELGVDVTVVDRADAPLQTALGQRVGRAAAGLQLEHGVDLRMRTSVRAMVLDGAREVRRVDLDDGSSVDVDAVVVAIGSVPNVGWLAGSGLAVDPRAGVACDGTLRAGTTDGPVDASVYAAGDVAQVPHPVYDGHLLAVEHWGTAVDHGTISARNVLGVDGGRTTVTALPRFWSNQFGVSIKSVGVPSAADQLVVAQGSVENQRGVVVYGRAGRTVAAVALNAPRELEPYAAMITAGAAFPPVLNVPDWPEGAAPRPVPVHLATGSGTSHEADAEVVGPAPGAVRHREDPANPFGLPALHPVAGPSTGSPTLDGRTSR